LKIEIKRLKKKKIVVLMGGISSERSISLVTGEAVYQSLKKQGFKVERFDLKQTNIKKFFDLKAGFVFIALHGKWGEDGVVQSVLEMKGIPYSGCGPLSSAVSMNKLYTKYVMTQNKIPTPRYWKLNKKQMEFSKGSSLKKFASEFPLVEKPVSQGSALGVGIANSMRSFRCCVRNAGRFEDDVLIEKYIHGTEITVGILGRQILPTIEIVPKGKFYDFESKYEPCMSTHVIPARISKTADKKAADYALRLFQALGCKAISRVDMIVDKHDSVYVLEINTIPGMTRTSLLPDAARAVGKSFDNLIVEIINYSLT
jgi:D-alanine-D-alanine ligase